MLLFFIVQIATYLKSAQWVIYTRHPNQQPRSSSSSIYI